MNPLRLLRRLGLDPFLLSLLTAVALGALVPALGRSHGLLHLDLYTNYGVGVVFLLYGLTLSPERLRAGLMNWRLHLVVLTATFVIYPLLVWALGAAAGSAGLMDDALRFGFFFLAASPSTISSSVAMTSIARGNVAGAVFNASLSSMVGVVVTPLWVNFYMAQGGHGLPLGPVVVRIVLMVLVPIAVGQLLHRPLHAWLMRNRLLVTLLDRGTILTIVFNSLSDSMVGGVWQGRGVGMVATVAVTSVVLFLLMFFLLRGVCRLLGFAHEDMVAGVFCGTKKSLAAGVPMARIMFGGTPSLGMVVLPFVVYHFLQLLMASVIARRWARAAASV